MSIVADDVEYNVVKSGVMLKLFYLLAGLAVLSAGLSVAGKWLGTSIVMAGHTDDTSLHEIVIGDDVISAHANAIRFQRQRADGIATRLDLYFRYPEMEGYSLAKSADFNNAATTKSVVFVSFEPRQMSRDMTGRLEPIYRRLIVDKPIAGPSDLSFYDFTEKSGYLNELLAVSGDASEPFVARCLTGTAAQDSLAPCERDIHVGRDLSLTYRFPKELLDDWRYLDAAVNDKARQMLRR